MINYLFAHMHMFTIISYWTYLQMGQTIPEVGGQTKPSSVRVQDLLESLCREFPV